ncbi:PTS glucose transporter subunit IIA [Sporosarcina sp. FSL K6-1540]|uniref:PTS system glucose-specific IIA component n=1 Tax=Sporosarcina psychrophila TaxID=1476 RepID=A0ABV2K8N5_SPOPS|nr:PTS glucose transporter subunit IIA [Sporosarcina psychrophila]AMQ06992.1 PTS glucose transporter subunit IIA [Sporosarcina psychrophila]
MLSKLFKKSKLQIFAPINGEIIPLDQVPDPVFSQKMLGEGVAIMPKKGSIHAPIDGTVILVSDTKHAIGLRSSDGTEILIHIGLETVSLKGNGFTVLVKAGDAVSVGQSLIEVDWDYISEHAKSIITPIVITNSAERNVKCEVAKEGIMGETVLMTISTK